MCKYSLLLISIAICIGFCFAQGEVLLEESSEVIPISGASGGRVELPCDVTAALPADSLALVIWYKQGHSAPVYTFDTREDTAHWSDPATLDRRATFTTNTKPAVLILEKLRPEDSGVYRCRVDFSRSPTKNSRLNLTVLIPPERLAIFDNDNKEVVKGSIGPYDEGARINVTCVAIGGRPTPKVSWWKSHALLGNADGSSTVTLQLRRQDLDSEVTCQALTDSSMAPVSKTVTIDMNLPPVVVNLHGADKPLIAGQKTELVCQIAGARPKPLISWWKSGVRLASVKESKDGNITTSVVSFVPSVEDAGRKISCRSVQPNIPMSTREDWRDMEIQYSPVATLDLGSNLDKSKIIEGSDVYLECKIKANPWHTSVHFTHNGSPVRPVPGILVANQSLVLQRISRNLKGPYVCVARNARGEGRSEPLHLDVKYPPSCKYEQTTFYRASKGDTVDIKCEMDANPRVNLTYRWWFNASSHIKKEIDNNKSHEGLLPYKLQSASDYGWVVCTAANEVGEVMAFFGDSANNIAAHNKPCVYHVLPAEKPSPIVDCIVDNIAHDSLAINCTPGGDGGSKQHFILEIIDTSKNQRLVNTSSLHPSFVINMLPSATRLTIRVRSANARGSSRPFVVQVLTLASPRSDNRGSQPITVELTPLLVVAGAITLGLIITSIAIVIAVRCRSRNRRRDHKKDAQSKGKMNEEETSNVPLTQTKVTDSIDSIDKNPDIIPMDSLPRDSSSNASTDYSTMKPLLSRSYTNQNACWPRDLSPQYMCAPLEVRRGDIYSGDDRTINRNTIRSQDWTNCESLVALNPGGLLNPESLHHQQEYLNTPPPPAMYGTPLPTPNFPTWSCATSASVYSGSPYVTSIAKDYASNPYATSVGGSSQFASAGGNPYATGGGKGYVGSCRGPITGCFVRPAIREYKTGLSGPRLLVTPPIPAPTLNPTSVYESVNKQTSPPTSTQDVSQADKQTNGTNISL